MNPASLIKGVLRRILPDAWQYHLRRWYAPRLAARFTEADWPVASTVRALIQPGDTVADVGANIGYISARLASMVGPDGTVYAVEPVPETFDLLSRTARYLHLDQVRLIHACASSTVGEVTMEVPVSSDGGENLYESRIIDPAHTGGKGRQVKVRAFPLDQILADAKAPVSFIKIDVEGHELEVLRGATATLADHQPALYMEVSGDPDNTGSTAFSLFSELGDRGYKAFWMNEKELVPRESGDQSVDYFFLLPRHVQLLRTGSDSI